MVRTVLRSIAASALLCMAMACSQSTGQNVDTQESEISTATTAAATYTQRLPQDEVIYFVIPDRFENANPNNDRGGFEGTRLDHGFDPAAKGFYNGGDLQGLTQRLDYIAGLGVTAIWLGPIYQNKPVQGAAGEESSGYHGYWITDFLSPDSHLGTEADLKAFVDGAHAKGIKIYLDIITNHTADVIQYRECHDPDWPDQAEAGCRYRSLADYPYTTRGGVDGEPINDGFMGDRPPYQTVENFAALERYDFAYTPFIPEAEQNVKNPAWLNDVRYYHNRGDTTFEGENSLYGDFFGLDDLATEDPFVVEGFIDIYKTWITKYRMDGFRIDTARHVNPEFWRAFNPAMREHAASLGIPNFYIFGEVYNPDPAGLARFTRVDNFPTVLDFGLQSAVQEVLIGGEATIRFDSLFDADNLYADGAADIAPTFLGNHDMGRFAGFLRAEFPQMTDDEMLARLKLGHAFLFFARGVPVIYYGDEQGFVSDGNDQLARENMFPSRVAVYNDNILVGTDATTAESNFDTDHPLYLAIAEMAQAYHQNRILRRGKQVTRLTEIDGGVFAFSRVLDDHSEALVVMNFRNQARNVNVLTDPRSTQFAALLGNCPKARTTTGVVNFTLAPFEYAVCQSNTWK